MISKIKHYSIIIFCGDLTLSICARESANNPANVNHNIYNIRKIQLPELMQARKKSHLCLVCEI